MKNLSPRKFVEKIGFSITLLGLSLSAEGLYQKLEWGLSGIIALAAVILLFEKKSTKPKWQKIVHWAEDLDITYIAFGLGLLLDSSKFSSNTWAVLLLALSGTIFAGVGISKLIGTGFSEVIKTNTRVGILLGFLFLAAGVVILIMTWSSIKETPMLNAPTPILIICLGGEFIYFAWRKWHKARNN